MTAKRPTIVVCGATGQQGGAVLGELEASGDWHLVALSRDPDSARSKAIRARGIDVRLADLCDPTALASIFSGAYGVYGVTTNIDDKGRVDTATERVQGFAIAQACASADVRHLVMSTVLYISDEQQAIPYVATKYDIEQRVAELELPCTFLRPGSFMDEIGGEYLPVKRGVITGQADGDVRVPYVACRDIGAFARLAFDDPDTYIGRKLNLVGDFISGDDLAELLGALSKRPVRHKAPPMWLMHIFARQWITLRRQFENWGRPPHPSSMLDALEQTRQLRPDTLTFERYLETTGFTA